MPRYHYHLHTGAEDRDETGIELHDLEEAKCEAVKTAGRLICDDAAGFWNRDEWRMTVTDVAGLTLFELHLVGIESAAIRRQAGDFATG
jgi:hypothetical protein